MSGTRCPGALPAATMVASVTLSARRHTATLSAPVGRESLLRCRETDYAAAFFAALAALAFLRFATGFAFAAAETFCFGADFLVGASDTCLSWNACQRALCASAILARAAALILRRLRFKGSVVAARFATLPDSMALSWAISRSILCFWDSKPWMAATINSVVSFRVGIAALPIIHRSVAWTVKDYQKPRPGFIAEPSTSRARRRRLSGAGRVGSVGV